MRRLALVLVLTFVAAPLFAIDSPTATKFLRAYVDAICTENAGDHQKAVSTITPFAMSTAPQLSKSAKEFANGELRASAISAAWAIVNEGSKMEFAVGRRERKDALNALRASFGKSISDGPKKGQNELEIAAATMAYFLTQELQDVAHPRRMSPRGGSAF